VWHQPRDLCAVEGDRATVGLDDTGDGVESGGLTGTVGADQGSDRSIGNLEGCIVDGDDATVSLGDSADFQ
jgi:hypothetical protein